jgi:integration host factor subunit alpha
VDILVKKARELVESLLEPMKTTLESGEDVLVSGFGKFSFNPRKKGEAGIRLPVRM